MELNGPQRRLLKVIVTSNGGGVDIISALYSERSWAYLFKNHLVRFKPNHRGMVIHTSTGLEALRNVESEVK